MEIVVKKLYQLLQLLSNEWDMKGSMWQAVHEMFYQMLLLFSIQVDQ